VAREGGFTLIEMLVAFMVIGALLAIAVPSYLGFSGRAEKRTAAADVRSAVPIAEAYRVDHETYAGMTVDALKSYDDGLAIDTVKVSDDGKSYCLDKRVDAQTAFVIRGSAPHTPAGASAGDVDENGLCPAIVADDAN
jgi:prepilin-type N-terminal cleavage/methylation domain-containing protein